MTYKHTCVYCDHEFKFKREDGVVVDDLSIGEYITVSCPKCKKKVARTI